MIIFGILRVFVTCGVSPVARGIAPSHSHHESRKMPTRDMASSASLVLTPGELLEGRRENLVNKKSGGYK